MRKVLTISYFYPPFDCTAALEASKFTKFLPDHGWTPIVVTTDSDYPKTLPTEIPQDGIHRTKQVDINRLPKMFAGRERVQSKGFVTDDTTGRGKAAAALGYWYRQLVDFPDAQIGWYPFALKEARRLVRHHRPEAILSSAWPVTNHLVAARIAREEKLPWLADFRDLWTANHHFQRRAPLRGLERRLERRVIAQAHAVSAPSHAWARYLETTFNKPAYVLPNGFDPQDYPSDVSKTDRFILTYTGMFYPEKQDPEPLLQAIASLQRDGVVNASNFQLKLVGRYLEYLRPTLIELGIDALSEVTGMVSHDEALAIQRRSSALVFFLWTRPEGRGWYSAKLYEYLGSQRPILAIGPSDTDAGRFIQELEAGVVLYDSSAIAGELEKWIADPKTAPRTNDPALATLEWKAITEDLAQVLDSITSVPR